MIELTYDIVIIQQCDYQSLWTYNQLLNLQHQYSKRSNYFVPIFECINRYYLKGLLTTNEFNTIVKFINDNSHLF